MTEPTQCTEERSHLGEWMKFEWHWISELLVAKLWEYFESSSEISFSSIGGFCPNCHCTWFGICSYTSCESLQFYYIDRIMHFSPEDQILLLFFYCILWIQQMLIAVYGGETYVVQWKQFCTWCWTDWHPSPNRSHWCYLSKLIDSCVHSSCLTRGEESLQNCWVGQRWQPTMTL